MIKRLLLFITINFVALAIGGLFTPNGISSEWYQTLNKAPWTPPGWFFGLAWTTIMICLSLFMAYALKKKNQTLTLFYSVQLFLNVIWTPTFFYYQKPLLGLFFIVLLTILIGGIIVKYTKEYRRLVFLLVPYFIWLCIATSLNLYVIAFN